MRENKQSRYLHPHYIGFILPESPYSDDKCLNSQSSINLSKCCFIGYGIDCFGKFRDLPHLCLVNQIGIKFSQEVSDINTPSKDDSLLPRRDPLLTPNTAPSMGVLNMSRNSDTNSSFKTAVKCTQKRLFESQITSNDGKDLPSSLRLLVYSYLDRSSVLQKISILST